MGRRIQPLSIILFVADVLLVLLALFVASQLRASIPLGRGGALPVEAAAVPAFLYLVAALLWMIGLSISGAYNPQQSLRWYMETLRVLWGGLLATGLMAGLLFLTYRELSRLQFAYFFITSISFILTYRALLRVYFRLVGRDRPGGRTRVLILGAGSLGERVAQVLLDHSRWGFQLVGFLDDDRQKIGSELYDLSVLGSIDELRQTVEEKNVGEIWIALPADAFERLEQVVAQVETLPVRIKVVPDYFSFALIQTKTEILGDLPVIGLRDPLIEGVPRLIKRGFDLIITSVLLLILLPYMAVIAAAIKMDSRGPALFTQDRVGENGRQFKMLKFRTMRVDAPDHLDQVVVERADGTVVHKRPDDPRVTSIGRLLRRYSLDELPQLFNVIKGDMSLVGPRPELPWLVDRYDSWQRKRFAVPQGITGWWQINGRSERPMHLHTEDDLYYVYNYSLWLDIRILLMTPLAVLRGKGAF